MPASSVATALNAAKLDARAESRPTVFAPVKNDLIVGYTAFFKRLRKLNALQLVNLIRVQSGGGTSEIVLRYERERVREVCG